MIVEERNGRAERNLLTALLVSAPVLGSVAPRWNKTGLFASRWSNLIGGWAVQFWAKYRKAPGPHITQMYDRWAETGNKDTDTVQLVEKFLRDLSGRWAARRDAINVPFYIDQASEYFNRIALKNLSDEITAKLEAGDTAGAEKLRSDFRRIEMGRGSIVNFHTDEAAILAAFDDTSTEDLIVLPGAIGSMFKHVLTRDSFVCFEGRTGVGKSFWLMYLVWMAVQQKRRTAYLQCGDMSQNQVIRRLGSLYRKRPIYGDPVNPIRIPKALHEASGDSMPIVEFEEKKYPKDLTGPEAVEAVKQFGKQYGEDLFRLAVYPTRSITATAIEDLLYTWSREDWPADVVVIDYLDLLAPINGGIETRDQINETWQTARRMSQNQHVCLLAGTQTDANSYNSRRIQLDNFTGDRRKNDEVTAMVGINQTSAEYDAQLFRLNMVKGREIKISTDKDLWTANCLALGHPAVLSTF